VIVPPGCAAAETRLLVLSLIAWAMNAAFWAPVKPPSAWLMLVVTPLMVMLVFSAPASAATPLFVFEAV
jgi:hypothetical protein